MGIKKAIWSDGKNKISGSWAYYWAGDYFTIHLDGNDPETGLRRQPFNVYGDEPNFGKWKKINEPRED